jgi:hypothetical protein
MGSLYHILRPYAMPSPRLRQDSGMLSWLHLSRRPHQGTSIRPYLAAIHTVHIRAGFTSPTNDPVITSLRAGFKRATADRVASRPRSVALPAAPGALALRQALQAPRPTPVTAIAVGFLLALRPMSIRGLYQDDIY